MQDQSAVLGPLEFSALITIKDAYLYIPIFPQHRFLCFEVKESHFQLVALSFGLATAPPVFTKSWLQCWLYDPKTFMS